MAKARPSLSVQAQPVSTFVAPANVGAAAVELYDQQTVNLALMFADAFKDLSLTAAKFAGAMKQEANEEEVQRGMDLVNQSQKSYMQLVQSGEIKPGENPWMAVGAQKASGTMEGLRARAHFMSVYEKRSQEDSNFFNGPESFSALASQYAENVNSVIGTTPYMSRAFYESFNPFIASMALKHEENVLKEQERKVTLGVGAAVSQAVQDLGSGDPIIQNMAVSSLQEIIDDMRNSGYNGKQVNEAAVDYLIKEMIDGPQPEQAESILNSLKAGTGSLAETEYAKTALLAKRGDIQRARDRMTMEESQQFSTDAKQIVAAVVSGKMTEEEAMKWADDYLRSPDRKITVSPSEAESKIGWIQGSIKSAQRDAEIKREQETDNRLMGQIESLSMVSEVEASLSPQDFVAKRRKEFEASLEGLEPRKRIQYRALFDKTAEEKAEQIELARASQLVESVWMGNGVTQGIVPNLSESAVGFMNNPQANPPDFLRYKNQLDTARSGLGIAPDSEKAKQLYRQDYTRMDRVFTAIEQSRASVFADKTLQPGASDGPEVKAAKATERAKIRFMRMQAGMVFGDDREVQKNIQGYILALNPQNVETSATLTEVEDTLTSFMLAMKNRMPLETVIPNPTSTNSKFLIKELQWAYGQYSAGVPLMDIARDMSQRRGFAQQMNIDPYDPLGWLNFTGGDGKDAAMFNANFTGFLESNGITQSDSRLYAAKVFWDSSFAHLGTDSIGNMKKANQQAAEEVLQKTLKVRGSLIPRAQLNEAIDSNYVEAWLDAKGYPSDTTLVVVDMNPDGSALLAPRNPAGESVPNAVLIRSTELNTAGPELIKRFKNQPSDPFNELNLPKKLPPTFLNIVNPLNWGNV